MSTSSDVFKKLNKDFGAGFADVGSSTAPDFPRLSTGIFDLDLALGGGLPGGRLSMVYGTASSGKSTLSYKVAASAQVQGQTAVIIDLEGSWDPSWAAINKVDLDKILVIRPDTAEQAVDAAEAMIYAEDVGAIILDSIAAMVPLNVVESSSSKMQVAGNAMLVTKLMQKISVGLNVARRQGRHPVFFAVNQTRNKIGITYGNPEIYPGGNALGFTCACIFRINGVDTVVEAVNKNLPTYKEVKVQFKKWKNFQITARNCSYNLVLLPHDDHALCDVITWPNVRSYMRKHDLMMKDGSSWICQGESFPTQNAIKFKFESSPEFATSLKNLIFDLEVQHSNEPISSEG